MGRIPSRQPRSVLLSGDSDSFPAGSAGGRICTRLCHPVAAVPQPRMVLKPRLHLWLPCLPPLSLSELLGTSPVRPPPPQDISSGLPACARPSRTASAPSSSASPSMPSCPKLPFLGPVHARFMPPLWATGSLVSTSTAQKADPGAPRSPPPSLREHHTALPANPGQSGLSCRL